MSALQQFIAKYGKEALELAAKHPGKAAAGAAGLMGATGLGAYAGVHETKKAIPHEILKGLGLPPEWADQGKEAIEDALVYGKKHPVAASGIGALATSGIGSLANSASLNSETLRRILGMSGGDNG